MTSGAISTLITTYHELNSATIDSLTSEPSSLEFMRHVARNRPFVIRRGAAHWKACQKWNPQYLKSTMDSRPVTVAITPHGKADSVTRNASDHQIYFVKPLEELEPFHHFLEYIQLQEKNAPGPSSEVKYAQTQNDNLRNEYSPLYADVSADIPWARIALQTSPDAVNLWIGNSRSVTALHRDNYENIYVQILGRKHLVLLPPVEMPCVNERLFHQARYIRPTGRTNELEIKLDEDESPIPFPSCDPDAPGENVTQFSELSRPMRVTLEPGDMLYLPALWYHKVSQSCGAEGICVAVNYWYDMEWSGLLYPTSDFVRNVAISLGETDLSDGIGKS